jgi:hypothetical protein
VLLVTHVHGVEFLVGTVMTSGRCILIRAVLVLQPYSVYLPAGCDSVTIPINRLGAYPVLLLYNV